MSETLYNFELSRFPQSLRLCRCALHLRLWRSVSRDWTGLGREPSASRGTRRSTEAPALQHEVRRGRVTRQQPLVPLKFVRYILLPDSDAVAGRRRDLGSMSYLNEEEQFLVDTVRAFIDRDVKTTVREV